MYVDFEFLSFHIENDTTVVPTPAPDTGISETSSCLVRDLMENVGHII